MSEISKTPPSLEEILSRTDTEKQSFKNFLTQKISQKRSNPTLPRASSKISTFKKLTKYLLSYSHSQHLNQAFHILLSIQTTPLCLYWSEQKAHHKKDAEQSAPSPIFHFAFFLEISPSQTRHLVATFKDGLFHTVSCSCLASDVYCCPHQIACLLFLGLYQSEGADAKNESKTQLEDEKAIKRWEYLNERGVDLNQAASIYSAFYHPENSKTPNFKKPIFASKQQFLAKIQKKSLKERKADIIDLRKDIFGDANFSQNVFPFAQKGLLALFLERHKTVSFGGFPGSFWFGETLCVEMEEKEVKTAKPTRKRKGEKVVGNEGKKGKIGAGRVIDVERFVSAETNLAEKADQKLLENNKHETDRFSTNLSRKLMQKIARVVRMYLASGNHARSNSKDSESRAAKVGQSKITEKIKNTQTLSNEERIFAEIYAQSQKDSFGLTREGCGCECHGIAAKHRICGKDLNCHLCNKSHKRDHYVFRQVLGAFLELINSQLKLSRGNYRETQIALETFKTVSRFFFFILPDIEHLSLFTKTVKQDASELLNKILTNLFLSLEIDLGNYVDLKALTRSWKKMVPLEIPEEGWFGKNIERTLSRQDNNIEEPLVVAKKRVSFLVSVNRLTDAIVYSCAAKDYYLVGKCLAFADRAEEAIDCFNKTRLDAPKALESAKLLARKQPRAAFDFFAAFKRSQKKALSSAELDWVAKLAGKTQKGAKNDQKEAETAAERLEIGQLLADLPPLRGAELRKTASRLKELSAETILTEFFRSKDAMSDLEILVWAFGEIAAKDGNQLRMFTLRVEEKMVYSSKLSSKLATICKNLYPRHSAISVKLSTRFAEILAKHSKSAQKGARDIPVNDHGFLLGSLDHLTASISEEKDFRGKRASLEDFLGVLFTLRSPSFLFDICKKASDLAPQIGLDKKVAISFGKKLFTLQLSLAPEDPNAAQILRWLLRTSAENIKLGGEPADSIIKHEFSPDNVNNSDHPNPTQISPRAVSSFAVTALQKLRTPSAQNNLTLVADFMLDQRFSTIEEILSVVRTAFSPGLLSAQSEASAEKYLKVSSKHCEATSRSIASALLLRSPSRRHFDRLAALFTSDPLAWAARRAQILPQLAAAEELGENSARAPEVLLVLLEEDADAELVCLFLKRVCCGFPEAARALALLRALLAHLSRSRQAAAGEMDEDFWFCAVHFNLVVAVLRGLPRKAMESFVLFVEEQLPSLAQKTAAAFSQALAAVIRKKAKFCAETKCADFFDFLAEARAVFEKAVMRSEWDELLKGVGKKAPQPWLREKLGLWREENSFVVPMILIDD